MNEIYVVYELHKRKCRYKINNSTISILGKALRTPGWAMWRLVQSTPLTLFVWVCAWVRPMCMRTCSWNAKVFLNVCVAWTYSVCVHKFHPTGTIGTLKHWNNRSTGTLEQPENWNNWNTGTTGTLEHWNNWNNWNWNTGTTGTLEQLEQLGQQKGSCGFCRGEVWWLWTL